VETDQFIPNPIPGIVGDWHVDRVATLFSFARFVFESPPISVSAAISKE